jgi:hypothetical protein
MVPHAGIQRADGRPLNAHVTTIGPTPLPAFLRLPRELRDIIYEQYVYEDGGYVYNPETDKFANTDGSPITLSLSLVCRQLASELKGVAFRCNTLTFRTSFSEKSREDAGMHHAIVTKIAWRKKEAVRIFAPRLFTSEMARVATNAHPQFSPVLDGWSMRSQPELEVLTKQDVYCGEAPSMWRDCLDTVLRQISRHSDFNTTLLEESRTRPRRWIPDNDNQMSRLIEANPTPWRILDRAERDELAVVAQAEPKYPHYKERTKYTYSAASLALRFLKLLPDSDLKAIRNIKLLEEHESVAHSECHGRGFIEICRQYPKICIQRFANLWKTVFPVSLVSRLDYSSFNEDGVDGSMFSRDRLAANDITYAVGKWLTEASILPLLGMPHGRFTLILDGKPTPNYMTKIFEVVQRDMAFQDALDAAYTSGSLPSPTWLNRRLQTGYMFERLPDIIRSLSIDSLLVRCSFDPGQAHDVGEMVEKRHGWSLRDWKESWDRNSPRKYQTEAPLPPWHELRWQYVIV